MNSFTVSPFYAGRSAAWRGATLDDVPGYYTDQQADEWERGWYSIMDDERAEAMERERERGFGIEAEELAVPR